MTTTCKPEGTAVIDSNNPNNIIVTFVVRDASNAIVLSQPITGVGKQWTANKAGSSAESVLSQYLDNKALAAAASSTLPGIQSFINLGAVLASG